VEIAVYNLLVLAFYSLWRLVTISWRQRAWRPLLRLVAQLAALVALGFALGAVQLIPLYELVRTSFRQGSVSYGDVIGWAYQPRQLLAFVLPDVFGNPAHHTYLDVLDGTVQAVTSNFAGQPIDTIFWGVKNYVEGTAYAGILPLLLALLAILGYLAERWATRRGRVGRLSLAATPEGRYGRLCRKMTSRRESTPLGGSGIPNLFGRLPLSSQKAPQQVEDSPPLVIFRQSHGNLPYGTEGRENSALPLSVSERGLGGEVEAPSPVGDGAGPGWGLTPLFATLAVISLLFAFGTPLYALLFFGLPGFNQLHTPFRWIYPYTLSLAVLAGIGANYVLSRQSSVASPQSSAAGRGTWNVKRETWNVERGACLAGLGGLLAVLASYVLRTQTIALADWLLQRSAMLQNAFASGRMLYSYEVRNLASFALLLALAGAVIAWAGRMRKGVPRFLVSLSPCLLILLVIADLFAFGLGFNPAADPKLLSFTPPAVEFLQQDESLYRIFSFRNDKLLNANSAWLFGLQDARGYDSIIPKQYADFMSLLEDQRGFLLSNRIGDVYNVATLASPLLDLLNVKYVLSETPFDLPDYTLVYDDKMSLPAQRSNLLIYRNDDALPRAFAVYQAKVLDRRDWARFAAELQSLDPRQTVLLEETPVSLPPGQEPCPKCLGDEVRRLDYTPNQVTIQVLMADDGFLVLGDSYFPGWQAAVDGQESKIYRADGNFRAVAVPAGEHKVVFKYSPLSFRLGLFTSAMAAIVVLLALGALAWRRFYRESEQDHAVRRVAKNTLTQIGAQLANRLIDMLFAMLVLRLLGPTGQGKYALAIAFIGYFDILTNFGLNTLLTREVAKDRSQANRYLTQTTILRLLLWLGSLPIITIAVGIGLYLSLGGMTRDTALAIGLFALMLVPSNIATALTSVFNAYEKMEYPAAITVLTTLAKVTLGALALFLGWGFVGLAGMSILVSTITALLLFVLLYTNIPSALRTSERDLRLRPEFDRQSSRWMLGESYPLMINHLLASVFFRIDAVILPLISGPEANGYYTAAYKFIDGLNIIPAYLTLAIFPVISRYAESARDTLIRAYVLSLRVLLIIALPITVGTTLIAPQIMELFGGRQYLPYSAQALAVLIWFLPFSYINSVTQYVLIAVNQQRFLTVAFLIGATFNIVANLLLIPRYSFMAAATVTVLSELVLFAPFYYSVHKHVGALPWVRIVWQPALASALMGGVTWWLLPRLPVLVVIALAAVVYFAGLLALGTITAEDVALVRKLLRRPAADVRVEQG